MRQKLTSVFLACLLLCPALFVFASAEPVVPAPPSWCPEDEYAVFDGSAAYDKENWSKILLLRETVAGQRCTYPGLPAEAKQAYDDLFYQNSDPGVIFELGLIELKLWNQKDGELYPYGTFIENAARYAETDQQRYACLLWAARAKLISVNFPTENLNDTSRLLDELSAFPRFSWEHLLDTGLISDERKLEAREMVYVQLDDKLVAPIYISLQKGVDELHAAQVRNSRTMVPIRYLSTCLGAEVTWDGEANQVSLQRAGDTIVMTLGQTTAYHNDAPFEMDAAPYADQGRTYIPVRYMAEFFGQTVTWDPKCRRVTIQEDKTAAGSSNLETWAIPMGAMRNEMDMAWDRDGNYSYGEMPRTSLAEYNEDGAAVMAAEYFRSRLASDWDITSREDLIYTVRSMTDHGHNDSFQEAAATAASLSSAEMNALTGQVDAYMWPQTKALAEKWGDRGILAWDLMRMSNLVQWGYTGGYLTYSESLALLEPAAVRFRDTFSNWKEAYENYLDGYNWWARNDMTGKSLWKDYRGGLCQTMLSRRSVYFDDALFTQDILPVPGLTAQQLLDEVLAG